MCPNPFLATSTKSIYYQSVTRIPSSSAICFNPLRHGDELLGTPYGKTAHGLLRRSERFEIVAVASVDAQRAMPDGSSARPRSAFLSLPRLRKRLRSRLRAQAFRS
jgi:hypothetical protein